MVWDAIYSLHLVGIPKGKTLMVCRISFNVLPLIEGLVSSELSKPEGVVMRVSLVCTGEAYAYFISYLSEPLG